MKLTINRKKLIEALEACQRARMSWRWCNRHNLNTAFSCFIFRIKTNSSVDIIGTDREWCVKKSVYCETSDFEPRVFAVEVNRWSSILKSLDDEYITIKILYTQICVMHACGEFSLPMTGNPEEVIQMTDDLLGMRTDISVKGVEIPFLSSTIKRCINFVSQDEFRPAINGICINSTQDYTDIVGTNGYKLIRIRRQPICEDSFQTIIPYAASEHLPKILPRTGEMDLFIQPYSGEKDAPCPVCIIKTLDTEIAIRTAPGKYPDYNLVIPPSQKYEAEVSKNLLIKAIKRANMLSDFDSPYLYITFEPNLIKIETLEGDTSEGYTSKETMPCKYSGEKMKICFRAHLLQDCICNIATSNVRITFSRSSDAVRIMPTPPTADEELITLVMPCSK